MPQSSKWSLSLRFPHQNLVYAFPRPHSCYITHPSHYSRFDHPNSIGWGVQIIKLLIMYSSPLPCYLVPLRPKYSQNTLSLRSSLDVGYQVSCPYTKTGKIIVLCILIFYFLDSKLEDKRFRTEWQQAFPDFYLLLISSWTEFSFVKLKGTGLDH